MEDSGGGCRGAWRACRIEGVRSRLKRVQVKMTTISSDASKTSVLEREIKEKNAQIGRLRHEGASLGSSHPLPC